MTHSATRPTWDEYFKEIVNITSKRSVCPRLKVGCLLIKDNRIIAQGYHEPIYKNGHNIGTIHAEQNAITDCARRGVSTENCTAIITHYPCFNCFKLLAASGVESIKYINDYNNDSEVFSLAKKKNMSIIKI